MIKARAHKETQQTSAPGHADYVEKEPDRSNKVAVGFLLFVMACMAFLRNCIPMSSSEPKERHADNKLQNSDDDQLNPDPPPEHSRDLADGSDDEPTASTETEKKHTSNVVPLGPVSHCPPTNWTIY